MGRELINYLLSVIDKWDPSMASQIRAEIDKYDELIVEYTAKFLADVPGKVRTIKLEVDHQSIASDSLMSGKPNNK